MGLVIPLNRGLLLTPDALLRIELYCQISQHYLEQCSSQNAFIPELPNVIQDCIQVIQSAAPI